jgi:hypothetical protein
MPEDVIVSWVLLAYKAYGVCFGRDSKKERLVSE